MGAALTQVLTYYRCDFNIFTGSTDILPVIRAFWIQSLVGYVGYTIYPSCATIQIAELAAVSNPRKWDMEAQVFLDF